MLDACRYDYFKEIFPDYLDGELFKRKSVASHTSNWLLRNFGNENCNDVVYISAHPDINSMGIEAIEGFKANEHFYKIIDVWETDWNSDIGTVPPEKVAKNTKMMKIKHPDKRLISHFLQPHYPYIGSGFDLNLEDIKKNNSEISGAAFRSFVKYLVKLLGWKQAVKFGDITGLRVSGVREVARKYGKDKLKGAYRKNLKIVLEEISNLIDSLPGKTIITSDHGELLGEDGLYGHVQWSKNHILREVPWFVTQ